MKHAPRTDRTAESCRLAGPGWMELQCAMSAFAPVRPIGLDAPTFAALNPAQRRAAEYGIAAGAPAHGPLLVIAGAGSGKTLTLAARVARLVLAGADPARILLLTFSRRAAAEMERRVGQVLHEALGLRSGARRAAPGLVRHLPRRRRPAAARPRRGSSASTQDFTVDDRGDSEDLIQRAAPAPRPRGHAPPLPAEGDLPGDLLARRQRAAQPGRGAAHARSRGAPMRTTTCKRLFAAYVEDKQAQHVLDFDDLLVWWAAALAEPALRRGDGGALRPRPGRRVPGHQPAAGGDPARA